jgi:hypothetical protein
VAPVHSRGSVEINSVLNLVDDSPVTDVIAIAAYKLTM